MYYGENIKQKINQKIAYLNFWQERKLIDITKRPLTYSGYFGSMQSLFGALAAEIRAVFHALVP